MADALKGRPATLDRWPGERRDHHRALLLWAMQGPASRSMRAVARALGISDGSIRNWKASGCWRQRVEGHGDDGDQYALDQYRAHYMADFGPLELPQVARFVVRPMGATDLRDPVAQAAHDARRHTAHVIPAAHTEIEQAAAQAVADHRRDQRVEAARHIKLVDASLGLIARKLKADEVRVTVRDIPVLLDCRARLVAAVSDAHDQAAGPGVVDSARVAHAKATGGDLVAAMHEDAVELVAILGALQASRGADRDALAAGHAEVREADLAEARVREANAAS
jgi:hypothetical protein